MLQELLVVDSTERVITTLVDQSERTLRVLRWISVDLSFPPSFPPSLSHSLMESVFHTRESGVLSDP